MLEPMSIQVKDTSSGAATIYNDVYAITATNNGINLIQRTSTEVKTISVKFGYSVTIYKT